MTSFEEYLRRYIWSMILNAKRKSIFRLPLSDYWIEAASSTVHSFAQELSEDRWHASAVRTERFAGITAAH
jgi:hypothetical protein